MISIKHTITIVLVSLGLTLLSFWLHVLPSNNTMINYVGVDETRNEAFLIQDGFLNWAVDFHENLLEFKKRPLTTYLVKSTAKIFNVRISVAFVLVNFLLTFLGGLLVYYLSRLYNSSHKSALLSLIFYHLSFSILFAYFIPIATYDEPLQYLFILLSFVGLKTNKSLLFIISISLAIITRETSLLFLPVMMLFFMDLNLQSILSDKQKLLKVIVFGSLPFLVYVAYSFWFYKTNPEMIIETEQLISQKFTYHKTKNFRDVEHTIQTLQSTISVNLLPLFLLINYNIRNKSSVSELKIFKAFWVLYTVNFILVLISSYAEESRVFTIPYLILFPLFGKIIKEQFSFKREALKHLFTIKNSIYMVLLVVIFWHVFKFLSLMANYKTHENKNLFVEYNTLVVLIVLLVYLSNRIVLRHEEPQDGDSNIAQ